MTWDEYNKLFHKTQANLVAFVPLLQCDAAVIKMIEEAVAEEREACADLVLTLTCMGDAKECFETAAAYIRARGEQ